MLTHVTRHYLLPTFERLRADHAAAFRTERDAAARLAAAAPRGGIVCDRVRVEIFSHLPPDRFVRWNGCFNGAGIRAAPLEEEARRWGHLSSPRVPARSTRISARTAESCSLPPTCSS